MKNLICSFLIFFSAQAFAVKKGTLEKNEINVEDQRESLTKNPKTKDFRHNLRLNLGETFNFAALGGIGISLGYDNKVGSKWSVGVDIAVGTFDNASPLLERLDVSDGSSVGMALRAQYYSRAALASGWYIAPEFQIFSQSFKTPINDSVSNIEFSFGTNAGYFWNIRSGVTVQLGIGPGYVVGQSSLSDSDPVVREFTEGRFFIIGDLNLGYAF